MIGTGKSPGEPGTDAGQVEQTSPFVVRSGQARIGGVGPGEHLESSPPGARSIRTRAGSLLDELDSLAGSGPPAPAQLGRYAPPWGLEPSEWGIPDWGALKLSSPVGIPERYPDRTIAPGPALDPIPFPEPGHDPSSDWIWNSGILSGLPGAGAGTTWAGAFGTAQVARTLRVYRAGSDLTCTVSGQLYPADRGCLALLWWPVRPDGTQAGREEFLAEPLDKRVIAALLLGQGAGEGLECGACDGGPGGIFDPGRNLEGRYDPFGYPGRASGQYDLEEILAGVDRFEGKPLRKPFDDLNQDGKRGAARVKDSSTRGAGQVRIGTVPGPDYLPYGVPIFGAGPAGYDPLPPAGPDGYRVGQTLVALPDRSGTNFFAYRLPQLESYETLPYTPRGMRPGSREAVRYFQTIKPHARTYPGGAIVPEWLDRAGAYVDADQSDWSRQRARYRHTFWLRAGGPVGSVWLLHFKTESAFERAVLEGVIDPADLYGDGPEGPLGIETNLVNTGSDQDQPPRGPAPAWGYAGREYHLGRDRIVQAGPDGAVSVKSSVQINIEPSPTVQWVSGVAYLDPIGASTRQSQVSLEQIRIESDGVWASGVWGDRDDTLLDRAYPPAQVAVPAPVVLSVSAFSQEAPGGVPNLTIPVGPTGLTDHAGSELQPRVGRIEIPLSHCGRNGKGPFGFRNPPGVKDPLLIESTDPIWLLGDVRDPSFTVDARLQGEIRLLGSNKTVTFEPVRTPRDQILIHTGGYDQAGSPHFGNRTGPGLTPLVGLFRPEKDIEERFLDETYRVGNFDPAETLLGPRAKQALIGPGLDYRGGFIPVPVRVSDNPTWERASWIRQGLHLDPLPPGQLQVAGFPWRNPRTGHPDRPFPAAGILQYPQGSYLACRPSRAKDLLPRDQPDYTGRTGVCTYFRVLDARLVGTTQLRVRIDGVDLDDIRYRTDAQPVQVHLKIPGLTTWLHLGRRDGQGPSKQDPTRDHAGCQLGGPDTFSGTDPLSGLRFCQVRVELGPQARTQLGYGDEVPVLFRVRMDERAIEFGQLNPLGPGGFGPKDPESPLSETRGICRVRIDPV